MEILVLGRLLWRRRLMLGLGAIAALALAVAVGSAPPESSALATTRVLLDTPQSQAIDTAPFGAETLPWRASLLSHLMASEPSKQRLARALGIPVEQLYVEDAALNVPAVPSSLPKAASEVASINSAPYVLTIALPNQSLPMIALTSAAPDARSATRLIVAARDVLRSSAPPPTDRSDVKPAAKLSEAEAADTNEPYAYVVDQVAPIRVKTVPSGKGPLKAIAVSLFVFIAWCACVVVLPGLVRRLRSRRPLQEPAALGR